MSDSDARIRQLVADEFDRDRKLEDWKKKKSPCLEGRLRHYFRQAQTRSLTPDLKCKKCGKTVAQVRAEQKGGHLLSTTEKCPECKANLLVIYESGFIVCLSCKARWKV